MQSSGGLTSAGRAAKHAALTVLSGPAGGVAGAVLLAQLATERDVICFDMGGTSCDVCVIEDGEVAETADAGDRRPAAVTAGSRHTHGRCRRGLDRVAGLRRRAARRALLGRCRAGTRLLRARWPAPDGHRREPAAGPAARRHAARGPDRARPRGRRAGRLGAWRRARARRHFMRRRHRPRGRVRRCWERCD